MPNATLGAAGPARNRVTPCGDIIAATGRGAWMATVVVEVSIDDLEFGMRIAQLRDVYCELLPELAGVLAMTP
jgi:hypothetical protein